MADQTTASAASSAPPCSPPLIPTLPDDIAVQILARVPRFHYPSLSLVSKSWRSAVNSAELVRTRSLLRTSQFSLYLNLRIRSSFHWYAEQNPQISKRNFIPLPSIPQHLVGSSFLALGPKIYVFGGSIEGIPTNNVWMFDCRFNKWEIGPKMRVAREFSEAGELDGKIYVKGGCKMEWRSIDLTEVFDPKTGLWSSIPREIKRRGGMMHASSVIGSFFFAMNGRSGVVYDVGCGEWASSHKRLDTGWMGRAAVVDNVLYCCDLLGKNIRWYDVEEDVWKELRGAEKGLPKHLCFPSMLNLDGKLCVVWQGEGNGEEVDIMCSEIEVKRDSDGGFSGLVLRLDVILVVPDESETMIYHCLAVEF